MGVKLTIIDDSVSCEGCGRCCMEMNTPPFIVIWQDGVPLKPDTEYELQDFDWLMAAPQEARDAKRAAFDDDRPDGSPCVWLDLETKRCRWYEFRPGICREFERGGEVCLATRESG